MAEEERQLTVKESFANAVPAGVAGGIIGAIIGVVLSLFAILNIGFSGLFASIVLGTAGFFIGFAALGLLTFVWYLLPPVIRRPAISLFVFIIIIAIIWLAIFFWKLPLTREYLKFASPIFDSVGKGIRDLKVNWGACLNLKPPCPFLIDWENPEVQTAKEELNVRVDFSDNKISQNNQVNLLVSLSVTNPELSELHIRPKCYVGKNKVRELKVEAMGAYSKGDEFVFGTTTNEELHTSFRCVGEIYEASGKSLYSDYVVVVLERPVSVKTTWPVQIGFEPKIGLVKSTMQFNAPYSIAMTSNNDMPFNEGKEYDFNIVLKKRAEDVKFKKLEYMSIKFSEDIMIDCEGEGFQSFDHELEIKEYSYENLKNLTQYDATFDKFSWPCKLYVANAPRQAVLSPIEIESKYLVYSDHEVRVIKSP